MTPASALAAAPTRESAQGPAQEPGHRPVSQSPAAPAEEPLLLVAEPVLGEAEKAALARVIDSGWITMGEQVHRFEQAFARSHGADDAVAVSSCTAGLHLILHALGLGPGDEVLVPSLTFVATPNSVLYVGATPVFVDIAGPDEPLMCLEDAAARCTPRTRAVILVHFAGALADRAAWRRFAHDRNLLVVEDAAHAPGLPGVGTIGVATAFSFYGNKNLTTAEGGMVIATDPGLLATIRQARGHGLTSGTFQRFASGAPSYDVTMLGFNYRLDELRGALGLVQLAHLADWNARRAELAGLYRAQIARTCPGVTVPFGADRASVNHIMPVLLPESDARGRIGEALRAAGIQTTIHYPPAHRLSFYRARLPDLTLPRTEAFAARELTLPLHPGMGAVQVRRVTDALARALPD